MKKIFFLIAPVMCLVLFVNCGEDKTAQQPPAALPFPTIKVVRTSVDNFVSYPASIEGIVNSQIRAKVAGYVQEVFVDEGEMVKKGQPLFRLETQSLSQDAAAAKAQINVAQVEVDKLKPLVEKNIISKVQLQTAMANLEQAKSNYKSITANIDYANIKSPVNGVVGSIPFRKGNLVSGQDSQPLTTVSNIEQVYAFFSMNEKDLLGFIKSIAGETLDEKAKNLPKVQLKLADGSIYDHLGQIETIGGEINPNTGTVQFRATFPNPQGLLRNGSSATLLLSEKLENVLAVPALSTFEQQNKNFVYLVQGDTLVTKAIVPLANVKGLTILEGLNEGDQILAKGVGSVRPGTKIIPQLTSLDSILNSFDKVFK